MDLCLIPHCSICCSSLLESDSAHENEKGHAIPTACGHLFHNSCLKTWYKKSKKTHCPICRAPSKGITNVILQIEPPPTNHGEDGLLKAQTKARSLEQQNLLLTRDLRAREVELVERSDALGIKISELEQSQQQVAKLTKLCKQQKSELAFLTEMKNDENSDISNLYSTIVKLDSQQQKSVCESFCRELNVVKREVINKGNLLRQKQREIDKLSALLLENSDLPRRPITPEENIVRPRKRLKPLYQQSGGASQNDL